MGNGCLLDIYTLSQRDTGPMAEGVCIRQPRVPMLTTLLCHLVIDHKLTCVKILLAKIKPTMTIIP